MSQINRKSFKGFPVHKSKANGTSLLKKGLSQTFRGDEIKGDFFCKKNVINESRAVQLSFKHQWVPTKQQKRIKGGTSL